MKFFSKTALTGAALALAFSATAFAQTKMVGGALEIHRKPQDWNSKTDYSCRYILTNFEPLLIRQILKLYVVCFNLSS